MLATAFWHRAPLCCKRSAHRAGKRPYKLKPHHARLAIHAAHTISAFVIELGTRKAHLKKACSATVGDLRAQLARRPHS
ncbi:abortive infection family protein [Pseudomonas sp. PLMAX]|uniref:abortive infection family protein n=1 Tax=Pseudomonas sp. PLMAX TaxID=2201998 RepID=UPI0038BBE9B5